MKKKYKNMHLGICFFNENFNFNCNKLMSKENPNLSEPSVYKIPVLLIIKQKPKTGKEKKLSFCLSSLSFLFKLKTYQNPSFLMATSLTLLTPNTDNPTTKPMEDEAKPAMEFVKSNKGRKPSGKGPYQKKQPQRGMGVAQLERLRKMSETRTSTTINQFGCEAMGASNVPVLHGVANYGVPPMMINGGSGGLWGWGAETDGLMMQRVVGNGGFGGFNSQVLVGNPGNVQVGCAAAGVVEASKELSSMPKFQHCKPEHCDLCFKV